MTMVVGLGKQRSTTISGSNRMAIITATILLLPYAHGLVAPAPRRPATQLDAVWSNELAIRDYQNLLQGKAEARREDGPSVVLGLPGDAIAAKFAEMAPGAPDALLAFGDAIPERLDAAAYPGADAERLGEFPIYVCCTSPEACAALEPVLQTVPEGKKEDLVFLQKGDMLEDLLKRHGLCRERQTQAVLYVGVNAYGKLECDRVSIGDDAMGEPKFAAETCATGKWAGAVADRLVRHKFHCGEQFYRDWRRNMIELVVFECVYNLVGVLHQKVPERGQQILLAGDRRHALGDAAGAPGPPRRDAVERLGGAHGRLRGDPVPVQERQPADGRVGGEPVPEQLLLRDI